MKSIDYDAVADLYDTYVDVDLDLDFWRERAGRVPGEVLELMAGTGRVSLPLARAGVRLVCVDYSAGLLDVLRRKLAAEGLAAEVVEMDVRALDLGRRFELVLLPFNAFSELVEPGDQRAALRAIRGHLAERGRFILTLHNPVVRLRQMDDGLRERGRFAREDGELVFLSESVHDDATGLVTGRQVYRLFDASGALVSEREVSIRFVLPSVERARALVEEEGFRVCDAWGDYACATFDAATSPFVIWSLARA
jgi:SAM-dependent methyltransferase